MATVFSRFSLFSRIAQESSDPEEEEEEVVEEASDDFEPEAGSGRKVSFVCAFEKKTLPASHAARGPLLRPRGGHSKPPGFGQSP